MRGRRTWRWAAGLPNSATRLRGVRRPGALTQVAQPASKTEGAERDLDPRANGWRQRAAERIDIGERQGGGLGALPAFSAPRSMRLHGDGHQSVSAGRARLLDHPLNGRGHICAGTAVQDLWRRRLRPDLTEHDVRPPGRTVEHHLQVTVRRPRRKRHRGPLEIRVNAPRDREASQHGHRQPESPHDDQLSGLPGRRLWSISQVDTAERSGGHDGRAPDPSDLQPRGEQPIEQGRADSGGWSKEP